MNSSRYTAFAPKRRPARYGGVGDAYRGNTVRHAAGEARSELAAWEGEGGRIAPSPAPPSRL